MATSSISQREYNTELPDMSCMYASCNFSIMKLIASIFVLSLWEQIGENPTSQNCTLCPIFQFLFFIYCIRPLEASGNRLSYAQSTNNQSSIEAASHVLQYVLYLVHEVFLQVLFKAALHCSLHWAFLLASRLCTGPSSFKFLTISSCSNAFYAL